MIFFLKKERLATRVLCYWHLRVKPQKRLAEVLGFPASTIHRKLHLQGFGREENVKKIEEHFVIVDESSMIDVYLFSQLFKRIVSKFKPFACW